MSIDEKPIVRRPSARLATVLKEALTVGLVALGFALLANQLSPRGINLSRNYFPTGRLATVADAASGNSKTNAGPSAPGGELVAGLEQDGVKAADAKTAALFFN